jgi:hypothetical protein|uniref:Type VI secretion protein n=1 Tax=Myoviridae sp. ctYA416 TaxID=2825125 RepID=A0A8S5UTR8_9CAUD|nr:MAG TPA: type VI secretion protein [Myoviridae sp. ctYA416]
MSDDKYTVNGGLGYTEVAILTSVCNKYKPGYQTFYVQALNPMNMKSAVKVTSKVRNPNIINKTPLVTGSIETGSNILIEMPKEVVRNFPTKFIPPGTRFLVSFLGGDINKPVIVGRDYDGYENHRTNK